MFLRLIVQPLEGRAVDGVSAHGFEPVFVDTPGIESGVVRRVGQGPVRWQIPAPEGFFCISDAAAVDDRHILQQQLDTVLFFGYRRSEKDGGRRVHPIGQVVAVLARLSAAGVDDSQPLPRQ
jgi:hypothetical protein